MLYTLEMTRQSNFRLSDEARTILEKLADANGISQAAVLEILIRDAGTPPTKPAPVRGLSPSAEKPPSQMTEKDWLIFRSRK